VNSARVERVHAVTYPQEPCQARDPCNLENDVRNHCARKSLRYGASVKALIFFLAMAVTAAGSVASERLPIEQRVAEITQSSKPTVVHFWAPWCPNCYGELKNKGWSSFIEANKDVNFIFITSWSGDSGDGRATLEKLGVGPQPNFQLLMHPNTSRRDGEKMTSFLGLPMLWLPATWVFREGKLRYALNYGEVRFSILQQLVKDAGTTWD
jgi:thiol-disulfide isomerase/thioredoxin